MNMLFLSRWCSDDSACIEEKITRIPPEANSEGLLSVMPGVFIGYSDMPGYTSGKLNSLHKDHNKQMGANNRIKMLEKYVRSLEYQLTQANSEIAWLRGLQNSPKEQTTELNK